MSGIFKNTYPDEPDMHVTPETIYAHIYAQPRGALKNLMLQSLRRHKSKRGPRGSNNSHYGNVKVAPEQIDRE